MQEASTLSQLLHKFDTLQLIARCSLHSPNGGAQPLP
jgi:hypothetical protein